MLVLVMLSLLLLLALLTPQMLVSAQTTLELLSHVDVRSVRLKLMLMLRLLFFMEVMVILMVLAMVWDMLVLVMLVWVMLMELLLLPTQFLVMLLPIHPSESPTPPMLVSALTTLVPRSLAKQSGTVTLGMF